MKTGEKLQDTWEQPVFRGTSLFVSQGRLYLILSLDDKLSEALLSFVSDVSFRESFPLHPRRETGVYRDETAFGDAEAKLDMSSSNYMVRITGTKLEEVRKLYEAIRAGTVLPAESWEQSQQGQSRDELEAELAESRQTAARLEARCGEVIDTYYKAQKQVRTLAEALDGQKWPLCLKSTVADQIRQAIDV